MHPVNHFPLTDEDEIHQYAFQRVENFCPMAKFAQTCNLIKRFAIVSSEYSISSSLAMMPEVKGQGNRPQSLPTQFFTPEHPETCSAEA